MRMRIISAAVVLGLGIVGVTLAQQGGEERRNDKAERRIQVVRLGVEIELLQIEHEVDRGHLKAVRAELRSLEGYDAGVLCRMQIDEEKKIADLTGGRFGPAAPGDFGPSIEKARA